MGKKTTQRRIVVEISVYVFERFFFGGPVHIFIDSLRPFVFANNHPFVKREKWKISNILVAFEFVH